MKTVTTALCSLLLFGVMAAGFAQAKTYKYKCPKCSSEFTLRSQGNRLYCTACGNAVKMNQYLLFEPEKQDTVYFDGIDKWYDFQKEHLEKEIEAPDFHLSAATVLLCAEPGKYGYQHLGNGIVTLTRELITYTGSVNAEEKVLTYPIKNIPMIPYAANEYIEVAKGPFEIEGGESVYLADPSGNLVELYYRED